MKKYLIFCFVCLSFQGAIAQLKAKAISYTLDVELAKFDKDAAEQLGPKVLRFETDVYYTADKVRTFNRPIERPPEYELTFRQRMYDQATYDEYNVGWEEQFVLLKKDHRYKPKATGKSKTILGYACKEYTLVDYQGRTISCWVTDKLGKNVCPWGNLSLKGTALEVTMSSGVHFLATDFAEGEVRSDFFDVPTNFKTETRPFPDKKK